MEVNPILNHPAIHEALEQASHHVVDKARTDDGLFCVECGQEYPCLVTVLAANIHHARKTLRREGYYDPKPHLPEPISFLDRARFPEIPDNLQLHDAEEVETAFLTDLANLSAKWDGIVSIVPSYGEDIFKMQPSDDSVREFDEEMKLRELMRMQRQLNEFSALSNEVDYEKWLGIHQPKRVPWWKFWGKG